MFIAAHCYLNLLHKIIEACVTQQQTTIKIYVRHNSRGNHIVLTERNTNVLPVFRFQAVHGVIIHGVQFFLTKPVQKSHWQQLQHDVGEPRVEPVHWQTVVRNLPNNPSTAPSAQIHLQGKREQQKTSSVNYILSICTSFICSFLTFQPAIISNVCSFKPSFLLSLNCVFRN